MPALAISTTFTGYDDVIPHLSLMHRYGIRNLELRGFPPRINYQDQDYLRRLKDELSRLDISISSYHLPFHDNYLSDPNEEGRQKALQCILDSTEAADFLGAECLVIHPGGRYRNKKEKLVCQEQSRKSIAEIYAVTRELGLPLALENMLPPRVGQEFDWLLEAIADLDPYVCGICFDSSHANLCAGEPAQYIEHLGSRIINVHFSDNHGLKDEHLFPFLGEINWESLLRALKRTGYNRPLTLEIHQCDALEVMLTEAVVCHSKLLEIWERVS